MWTRVSNNSAEYCEELVPFSQDIHWLFTNKKRCCILPILSTQSLWFYECAVVIIWWKFVYDVAKSNDKNKRNVQPKIHWTYMTDAILFTQKKKYFFFRNIFNLYVVLLCVFFLCPFIRVRCVLYTFHFVCAKVFSFDSLLSIDFEINDEKKSITKNGSP